MGPNLRRLFDDRNFERLEAIFECHGEALIEALEELVKINEGSFGGESERWEQLLAQLEAEAQP